MEALKNITQEQYDELIKHSIPEYIENFFLVLNNNFGDGEVLPFEYILHFFVTQQTNLGAYVDTYRMLSIVGKDQKDLLLLKTHEEVQTLHDDLALKYTVQINEELEKAYNEAMAPFSHLSGKVGNCRFELISNIQELNAEGSGMNHCIATYVYIIAQRQYVGMRVFNEATKERLTVGFLRYANNTLAFNQLKGWGNAPAMLDSRRDVIEFCSRHDIACSVEETDILLPDATQA